jgi:hypothetical protein
MLFPLPDRPPIAVAAKSVQIPFPTIAILKQLVDRIPGALSAARLRPEKVVPRRIPSCLSPKRSIKMPCL